MAEELIDDGRRDKLTRDELNALALEKGITDPEQFGTKAEVAAAINERIRTANAREASGGGERDAREPSAPSSRAEAQGQPVRGGAAAGDRDDTAAAAASRTSTDAPRGEGGLGGGNLSEEERLRREREDDAALRAGDALDRGRPPTFEELQRAQAQADKDPAKLAQEAADAAIRQGLAGVGAEFQPAEGEKPAFVARGRLVNPDGRKATRTNMMIRPPDEEDEG